MPQRSTDELDRLIREALEESDAELHEQLGEPSLPGLLAEAFRGRHRFFAVGGAVAIAVFFLLGIAGAIAFAQASESREMMLLGGATALCFGVVSLIKIWTWLEMNRQSLLREIKRVELQVVRVAQKVAEREHRSMERPKSQTP